MARSTTLEKVRTIAARVSEKPVSEILEETNLDDLLIDEWVEDIFLDEIAKAFDLPIGRTMILIWGSTSMPNPDLASLQRLSAFSGKAKRLLDALDLPVQKVTIVSIAASLDAGDFVPSGEFYPRRFPARNTASIFLGCSASLIAIFSLCAVAVLVKYASSYSFPDWTSCRTMLGSIAFLGTTMSAFCFGISFVPGLWYLIRHIRAPF